MLFRLPLTANEGWHDGITAPACIPGVISVGSVTDSPASAVDTGCSSAALAADTVPCFSNRNTSFPAIYAPGVELGNPNETGLYSGTSGSAAYISGIAAVMRSDPNSNKQAMSVSTLTANITGYGKSINDGVSTKRRVDLDAIIAAVTPKSPVINVTPVYYSITPNSSAQFTVEVLDSMNRPLDPQPPHFWSSSNPAVATIDSADVVHAHAIGDSTLTVTSGSLTRTNLTVDVQAPFPFSIKFQPNPVMIHMGNSAQIAVTATDQVGNATPPPSVSWAIWNKGGASAAVSSSGLVSGLAAGTGMIIASYLSNSGGVTEIDIPFTVTDRSGIGNPCINPSACH